MNAWEIKQFEDIIWGCCTYTHLCLYVKPVRVHTGIFWASMCDLLLDFQHWHDIIYPLCTLCYLLIASVKTSGSNWKHNIPRLSFVTDLCISRVHKYLWRLSCHSVKQTLHLSYLIFASFPQERIYVSYLIFNLWWAELFFLTFQTAYN